jgi:hypothetical protein
VFGIIKKIILWSYERGSWQYDVMCVVILAFIFLTPNQFLDERYSNNPAPNTVQTQRTYISTNEIIDRASPNARLSDLLGEVLSKRYQRKITVKRFEVDIEKVNDGSTSVGNKNVSDQIRGYRVWFD